MKFLCWFCLNVCLALPFCGWSERYVLESEQFYVDRLTFDDTHTQLETMDIWAERKKRVHLDVSGDFPKLESVNYQGSFGCLTGVFTGNYPELTSLTFTCTTCKMNMDFRGMWHQDASILIHNETEPIVLICPQNVGVIVHTKTSMQGKVVVGPQFTKQGRGIWNKTYHNALVGSSPVTLTFVVESCQGGNISIR